MKKILVLFPENEKPTKILDKNLKKIKDYDSGYLYKFQTLQYKSFHAALKKIFSNDGCFLVLGELTEFGEKFEKEGKAGPRRKKKGTPTIQDREGFEMVLDLDDHVLPDYDPLNPVRALTNFMRKRKMNCSFTWQITSSQKMPVEGEICEARVRIYFSLDKAYSLKERKAFAQSERIKADGSVFTCSQPIFTTAPIIEDGSPDPITNRTGFVKGKTETFALPKMTKEEVEKYTGVNGRNSEFDFKDLSLPKEFLDGFVYRRYLMPLAFHYVNLLKGDREAVYAIIHAKAQQSPREFDKINTYQYIDDAIITYNTEQREGETLTSEEAAELFEEEKPLPEFPAGILETWPMPWPMIWDNFKKFPRQMEEALLVPTILSLNGYFLRGRYITFHGRRPNMFFLNLTPSTGHKDVNSKNVIRDLDLLFRRMGSPVSLFSDILNTESSITSDTSFIGSFSKDEELLWINTEATRIFQQLRTTGNSNVAALGDKLIEVVDGFEITGKAKADGKIKTINNPNCQILFYAQPETIEQHLDSNMVDSGLFGRANLSIIPNLKMDTSTYSMFQPEKTEEVDISDEFYQFYTSQKFSMGAMSPQKKKLYPRKKSLIEMDAWAREKIVPLMEEDDTMQKVLSRIGNSLEQLYVIVLGICQLYDASIGEVPRDGIPVQPLFALAEYWAETKVYAIKNYVQTALDPIAETILEVLKNMIAGKPAMQKNSDKKILKEEGVIPASQFLAKILMHQKLSRTLSSDGDRRNVTIRAENIIKSMVRNGMIIEKKIGVKMRVCYGLPKE